MALLFLFPQGAVAQQQEDGRRIIIDIPKYTLTLCQGEDVIKQYPIAVGRPIAETPVGSYRVYNKAVNPTWHPNSINPVPPGPANPLGIRWMGFYRGYGIHGNNDPQSIGKSISGGCIRMFNYDVSELYSMVGIGIPVEVKYADLVEVPGENAVVAYRDIYSRENGLRENIIGVLDDLGLLEKITPAKLEKLFNALRSKMVVFSPNWVVKVNGEFLTADTIYDRTMIFVNAEELNRFFGTDIGWDWNNSTGSLFDNPVSAYRIDEVLYVSIADVARILGGKLTAAGDIEEIDYRINFVKMNGKFLTSDIEDFKTKPRIEAGLINPSAAGKKEIEFVRQEGFEYQIYSKYGYIEILRNLP
ncbi:MAG: L,D-transpeptidase [Bacillota bacterium]|nr:L,D-transpeptidase [Bacillota bacterium]